MNLKINNTGEDYENNYKNKPLRDKILSLIKTKHEIDFILTEPILNKWGHEHTKMCFISNRMPNNIDTLDNSLYI